VQRPAPRREGLPEGASEVESIVWLAHTLWRSAPLDLRAARELQGKLEAAPIRRIAALEHAFRDPRTHRRLGIEFLEVPTARLSWAEDLGAEHLIAVGVLTLVRSGYHRQFGVEQITQLRGRLATAFLLARTNDFVPFVRMIAIAALQAECVPSRAADLVACLPLVRRFSEWTRSARTSLEQAIVNLLASGDPACDAALASATHDRDPEVRYEAFRLLAVRHRGTEALGQVHLCALVDRVPTIRVWAARVAISDDVPADTRAALLAQMELDRSPAVRVLALRSSFRAGDREGVIRGLFDGNTDVRYAARDYLKRLGSTLPQRPPALALLADETRHRSRVIGALGALSEVGLRVDLPLIERFLCDPRPSVVREAKRTIAFLSER